MSPASAQVPELLASQEKITFDNVPATPEKIHVEAIRPRGFVGGEIEHSRLQLIFRERQIKASQVEGWHSQRIPINGCRRWLLRANRTGEVIEHGLLLVRLQRNRALRRVQDWDEILSAPAVTVNMKQLGISIPNFQPGDSRTCLILTLSTDARPEPWSGGVALDEFQPKSGP